MQYILSDEEFEEYRKIRNEHQKLKEYKKNFLEKCKIYAETHVLNCKESKNYDCRGCILGTMDGIIPYEETSDDKCPIGKYEEYGK
jgi:hypothetical protein